MPSKFAIDLFEVVKKWPKLFLIKMMKKVWLVALINNFFSWRCHDLKLNQHGLMIGEPMLIKFQVMRATGKKVIDQCHKNFEILKNLKCIFVKRLIF